MGSAILSAVLLLLVLKVLLHKRSPNVSFFGYEVSRTRTLRGFLIGLPSHFPGRAPLCPEVTCVSSRNPCASLSLELIKPHRRGMQELPPGLGERSWKETGQICCGVLKQEGGTEY